MYNLIYCTCIQGLIFASLNTSWLINIYATTHLLIMQYHLIEIINVECKEMCRHSTPAYLYPLLTVTRIGAHTNKHTKNKKDKRRQSDLGEHSESSPYVCEEIIYPKLIQIQLYGTRYILIIVCFQHCSKRLVTAFI